MLTSICKHAHIASTPLLVAVCDCMPHWTPIKPDTVVYTTIDEGYSGSLDDVGIYLSKLKADLKIGQPGYPSCVVLAGDQQTYAHLTNFKIKYPGYYEWFHTVPGDWHIMKNTYYVIKICFSGWRVSYFL